MDDAIARLLRQTDAAKAAAPPAKGQVPVIMSARIGEHEDRTRFVLELSDPVDLRTFTLSLPNRVVIDMPQVQWHLDGAPRPSGNGAIKSYRYGPFRPGNSRMVIDLAKPVRLGEAQVLPPQGGSGYRVVLDLFPTTQVKFDATAGWPSDLKARENAAQMASLPRAPVQSAPTASRKKVVVVDAGHGGIDSGTNGVNGLVEKNLVLATALKLKAALQERNFIVYLTRETDVFIPLKQRVAISRSYKADLFISLHADSNPATDTSGLSVYTLSQQGSDKEAAALARKENQSDVIAGVDLAGENSAVAPILLDLAQRDTMNKSSRFAETVVATVSRATDILPRQPHRSAAFAVLKAPDVPAVLIELGYLSNPSDARQMNTNDWRIRVADAIASAVVRHFSPATGSTPVARNGSE
jgi:N-acetylmuramoyl-L-alanine amidase